MDGFARSLITLIIDLFIILFVIRVFISESERFHPVFGMVFRATERVVGPLRGMLGRQQAGLACGLVILGLLILKGLVLASIPLALQTFARTMLQLYVFIIILIAGFPEYYTNPIASFGQRMVNPIRAIAASFSHNLFAVNIFSVVILLALYSFVTYILGSLATGGVSMTVKAAILSGPLALLGLVTIFIYIIVINALLTWVTPDPSNPIVQLLALISAPIIEPIRRVVPPVAGVLDLSPIIAILGLYVVQGLGYSILRSI